MSYGFDDAQDSSGKASFPLAPNVDNVTIKSAEYSLNDNNNELIKIVFDREGIELMDFIFPVNENFVKTNNPSLSDADLEEAVQKQKNSIASKLLHILTKFDLTKEQLTESYSKNANGDPSFASFAKFFVAVLNKRNTDPKRKFYMKTIRNKKGYVSVPPYAGFLQTMDSGECKLGWSQYELDLIERNTKSQPSTASAEVVEDSGDLSALDDL